MVCDPIIYFVLLIVSLRLSHMHNNCQTCNIYCFQVWHEIMQVCCAWEGGEVIYFL